MVQSDALHEMLDLFASISLTELDSAALLDRYEMKFLFPDVCLNDILQALSRDYKILEINSERQFFYKNWYFDTPDFRLYIDHHNGFAGRIKVRQRLYEQAGMAFFEVKRKYGELRTDKKRVLIPAMNKNLNAEQLGLVNSNRFDPDSLYFQFCNTFKRITLCNANFTERVTIDMNIAFENENNAYSLVGFTVMEIKQSKPDLQSPALKLMRELNIFDTSFSKYAFGAAHLFPFLKQNNLKPLLIKLKL